MARGQAVSTSAVTTEAGKGAEYLQAVVPDFNAQLGTSGATVAVPNGSTVESDPAPTDGMVVVAIPVGGQARFRVGPSATANGNDDMLMVGRHHFPIFRGWRVSMFGDGVAFNATVSMVLNRN